MAPADIDDHVKYLISCIRHSSGGKVDFEEVRKEFCIVSKGAAAKRYEQMMRALHIHPGQIATMNATRNPAIQSRRETFQDIVGPSKKRKRERCVEREVDAMDDGETPNHKAEGSNKKLKVDRLQTKDDELSQ